MLLFYWNFLSKYFFSPIHLRRNIYAKWAAAHAGSAMSALAGVVRKSIVFFLQLGREAFGFCLVEQLVDLGDRDANGARRAMVAIGAVAAELGLLTFADVGIVFLRLGGMQPVQVGL